MTDRTREGQIGDPPAHPGAEALSGYALQQSRRALDERSPALDAVPADADGVEAHIAACSRCRDDVRELSAVLAELSQADDVDLDLMAPPPRVWDRVLADLDESAAVGASPGGPTPPLRSVGHAPRRTRRSWRLVAAGLLIAAGASATTAWIVERHDPSEPPASVLARASMTSVNGSDGRGDATLTAEGDQVTLDVQAHDLPSGSGYLEVWLINQDGKRMVSVGVLPERQNAAAFPVTPELVDAGYTIVDISREPLDADPSHSGASLARGPLSRL